MSSDASKIATPTPPTQSAEQRPGAPAFALLLGAFAGTIALIWGFESRACEGVVAGAFAAMMRASFLAQTHPPELALLVLIFAAHLAIGCLAARRRPFRGREELLAMVLPLASFPLGLLVADSAWFESACALHPWR